MSSSGSRPSTPDVERKVFSSYDEHDTPESTKSPLDDGVEKADDSNAVYIKRPRNSFMMFMVEEREKFLLSNPQMPMREISQKLAEKWRELSDEGRKVYKLKSIEMKKQIDKQRAENPNLAFRPTKKPMSKAEKAAAALAAAAQASIKEAVADSESPRKIRPMKRPSGQSGSPAPPNVSGAVAEALGMSLSSSPANSLDRSNSPAVMMQPPMRAPQMNIGLGSGPVPMMQMRTPMQQMDARNMPPPAQPMISQAQPQPQVAYVRRQNVLLPQAGSFSGQPVHSSSQIQTPAQALDLFYLALCEPAFPKPEDSSLAPYPANVCYDMYLRMTNGQGLPNLTQL